MKENENKILITLDEYKELLTIKGKYEELKNTKELIKYIPITVKEFQPMKPTITYY